MGRPTSWSMGEVTLLDHSSMEPISELTKPGEVYTAELYGTTPFEVVVMLPDPSHPGLWLPPVRIASGSRIVLPNNALIWRSEATGLTVTRVFIPIVGTTLVYQLPDFWRRVEETPE